MIHTADWGARGEVQSGLPPSPGGRTGPAVWPMQYQSLGRR